MVRWNEVSSIPTGGSIKSLNLNDSPDSRLYKYRDAWHLVEDKTARDAVTDC